MMRALSRFQSRFASVARRLGMTPLGTTDRWYGETLAVFRLRPGAAG